MKSKALRIGLIGSGDDSSGKLLRLLVEQGMQIVHALLPRELTDEHIAATDLDVWLLDLDDSHWHDQLDELMDRSSVPIFFNEHQSIEGQQHLDYWCRNLISRMFELVADVPGLPPAAPAPARGGETLHIAFPQKTESKPSDVLNDVPAALDPDLLQEIEELEQLLQRKPDPADDGLADLDSALPMPAAATPAAPQASNAPPSAVAKASAPAAAPSASDPVAAAKARAAQIQQQAAANRREQAPSPTAQAVSAPPAIADSPSTTPGPVSVPPAPSKAEAKSVQTPPPVAIASSPTPVPPTDAAPVGKPADTATAAPPPPVAVSATTDAPAAISATEPGLEVAFAAAVAASVSPADLPPEKVDWPTFPAPTEPPLAADPDFAPMQPQPAAGPMREPVRSSPVSLVRNVAPVAPPVSKAATSEPVSRPADGYSEPVPTLTRTTDADLEFEAVDEADDGALPLAEHAELDVPMLESIALSGDFEAVADHAPVLTCDLWVLGASLGGPAALKRFFSALNQPLPICFLLAQHIDAHFLPVLGKILEQANPFYPVQVLVRPGLIEPGTLLLAPIEKRLRFLDAGQIVQGAKTWTPPYSPCIDDVLNDVAAAYPGQVHAIIFSGMGEDGVTGARAVAGCGGEVWVQDAESCASSVMPDAIDNAALARVRATPEDLAARLMARYKPAVNGQSLA